MGHKAFLLKGHDRALFGRGQIIQRLPGGVWAGASDMRAEYVPHHHPTTHFYGFVDGEVFEWVLMWRDG